VIWNIASSSCSICDEVVSNESYDLAKVGVDGVEPVTGHIFAFAMARAFGGIVIDETRGDFNTFLREAFERWIRYPSRRTIFDDQLRLKDLTLVQWSNILAKANLRQ
jgi:hypothetical protein